MKSIFFILFTILLLSTKAISQPFFQFYDSIPVKINSNYIRNPWAGGLNFVQASSIDLNQDGIKDLFLFDRTGNKIRTFINNGTADSVDYKYRPDYEKLFPNLHDWVLLADYNNDNREDVFSFADHGGGFKLYKNISTIAGGLQFTLIDTLIRSAFNPPSLATSNLYISSVDIPSFVDVDNDGDLDVITFCILPASQVQYHQNQSVELGYGADSLIFQLKNNCWGWATEDLITNAFNLHDTCIANVPNPGIRIDSALLNRSLDRHSGNCELCIDLDGDGDKELIVGSINVNNMTCLKNGGSSIMANWTEQSLSFPSTYLSTQPIDLTLFPCAFFLDVNNDGAKDLLVSPNSTNASEDFNSLLYFKNVGTTASPDFKFKQHNLLQDNMIELGEGAHPVFHDYDHDGLLDLFIGNHGYHDTAAINNTRSSIAQFHNIGTATQPAFELITRDYDSLSLLNLINISPSFGDMDGDGDEDMIVGASDGRLYYYRNTALTGAADNFVLSIVQMKNSFNRTIDVGDDAAPQIYDVDGDGKNDLIVGGRNGKIAYMHHSGSATSVTPTLDSVSYFFGHVNVTQPSWINGSAYPWLLKEGGITKLVVGESFGHLYFYDNIDGNLTGAFNLVSAAYEGINQGSNTSPCIADINNDGFKDLIVGNMEGGVTFYKGSISFTSVPEIANPMKWNFNLFPNPANNSVTLHINEDRSSVYTIEVFSILGELILTEKTSDNSLTILTDKINSGMYFCKVFDKTGTQIKKIIIQH